MRGLLEAKLKTFKKGCCWEDMKYEVPYRT